MMKVSHVLYKVKDLEQAVRDYTERGFQVEFGTAKNPHNALIYFSEGPYLELIGPHLMPSWAKWILKLFGKGKMVERITYWEEAEEGLIGLALENYETDFKKEKALFRTYKEKFFEIGNKRIDTQGRHLKYRCLFPDALDIPFLMTYFSIDPKPKNFTHPNGIQRIKSVSFGTQQKYLPLLDELCDDPTLHLFLGKGMKDLEYLSEDSEDSNTPVL